MTILLLLASLASADTFITSLLNVATDNIEDAAVSTAKIGTDAVDSTKILNGAVNTPKLATDSVTTVKLINSAVDTSKLATDSVASAKILNAAVSTDKVATDAITAVKVLNGAVETSKVGSDAITTVKLINSSVDTSKVASDAIQTAKLMTDAVTTVKLINAAVSTAKLHSEALNDSSKVASFSRFDSWGQSSVRSTFTVTQGSMTVRGGTATLFVDATGSNADGQIIFNSATGGANMFWQYGGNNQWGGLIRAGGSGQEHFTFYNYGGGSMNIGTSVLAPKSLLHVRGSITQDTVVSCSNGLTTNATGTITGCAASDARLKKSVADYSYDLSKFDELRPVTYEWQDYEVAPATVTYLLEDGKRFSKKPTTVPAKVRKAHDAQTHVGLIAQEVEALFPGAINGGGGIMKAIDPNAMNAILIQAIQDLRARVEALEAGP